MRKLKLLMAACALMMGCINASAQASFNQDYKNGEVVAAGGDYFLYNIGAKMFLTDGMDWGTHATADHAGRLITFATLSEGKYSIYTASASVNNGAETKAGYMTTNGYLDSGSNDANWEFTPVSVDGYTNAYTIKNSDTQYLYFNSEDARVNVGESTNNNYSYWIIVSKVTRLDANDYTFYLQNTDFNRPWERSIWTELADKGNRAGGLATNRCAEVYHKTFDMGQTITASVANGRYKLYAQAFYRKDGGTDPAYLYVNDATTPLSVFNGNGEGTVDNMNGASTSFNAGLYVNSVEAFVSDGSVKVGIKNDNASNWVLFDNFYLQYLGQFVMDYAVKLPAGGAMAADTWYYFDIAVAGDEYTATATTLGDIICVTDGYTKTSAAAGSVTLKAEDNSFSVQRYYVKSSSANNLVIDVPSYTYSVSSATADVAYIQPGKTVTVDYTVSTNDPSAVLAQNYNGVTFNGEAVTCTPTDHGFTFTVPANLANSTEFTLSIPTNAIGYEAGATYNAAQNITLTTTAVYDGIYYFFNTDSKKYMSRGDAWATRAITDDYGLPAYLAFDGQGHTKVKFFDNNLYLTEGGWLYTDNATGGTFMVEAVAGGYKFKDVSTSKYVALYDGYLVGDAVEGDNLQGSSNIWALETPAVYKDKDNAAALADAQAAVAASAAGFVGITTKAALESELTANYGMTKITITGAKAEKFQQNASGDGEKSGALIENVYYSETVNGLKPGLYKLSVDAFQRAASNDAVRDASGARSLIYVFAGSAKTQLKSWMDYGSVDAYGSDYAYDGKHYPNNEASAYAALETGNYANDVYVYVADAGEGTGTLTFGIKNPQNAGNNALWSVYENFTLTYYEAKATASEKKALADAIDAAEGNILGFEENEYAPYNNVAAVEALAAAKAIDAETATGVAVVEATSALASAVWTKNVAEVNAFGDPTFSKSGNDGAQLGWITNHSAGLGGSYHARAFVLSSGDGNYDNLASFAQGDGIRSAGYFRFDGTNSARNTVYTYGQTAGYTIPLKNAIYQLAVQIGGWGQVDKDVVVKVVNSSDAVIATKTIHTPNTGVNAAGPVATLDLVFAAPAADNYKVLLENGSASADNAIIVSNLSLFKVVNPEIAITAAGYRTYCSSYDLDFSGTGITAYKAVISAGDVTFEEINDGIVPANQGVLLKADKVDKNYEVPVTITATTLADNGFVGTVAGEDNVAPGIFVLMGTPKVGFYKTTQAFNVGANTAYLPAIAASRSFIGFDDETTGIKSLENVEGQDIIFDLSGRRVLKTQKGLYIINGKKVVK